MALLTRSAVADYLNIGTKANKVWALCGTGFNSLDESPNAQLDSKVYIHEDEASPSITRYESSFGFDIDTWNDQEAVMLIYDIARNRKIGSNALVEYLRTDFKVEEDGTPITTVVPARLFTCSVEVSDIQGGGGETLTMSGNLNVVGKFLEGTFDLESRVFTEGAEVPAKQVKDLTVTLTDTGRYWYPGQLVGNGTRTIGEAEPMPLFKVNVTPDIAQNNKYLVCTTGHYYEEYDKPYYNDAITGYDWEFWNGTDERAIAEHDWLLVAEVSNNNLVKGFGAVCNGEPNVNTDK